MTQPPPIEIELVQDTPLAQATQAALEELLDQHDLAPYLFTRRVRIEPGVVPHSHPVLTLNTRYADDLDHCLATFLHEQIHWFLEGRQDAIERAIADLRRLYPNVPIGGTEGARTEHSTYLHLIVNWLELHALERYLGRERAGELLRTTPFYRWIYATVLRDEQRIGAIVHKQGLAI